MKYQHIMIDIETLGRNADAVILSVAMVKFNFGKSTVAEHDLGIQLFPEVQKQFKNRSCDWNSIQWWLKQSEDTQQAMIDNERHRVTMERVVESIRIYIDSKDYKIWANGASFDPPIVRHLFSQYNIKEPWDFRRVFDVRTINWLSKIDSKSIPLHADGIKHDALSDCLWQIDVLNAQYNEIKNNKT